MTSLLLAPNHAGVDEVGRGPLIGPVVTAAVILDPSNPIEGLADSKQLSEKRRLILAEEIRRKALAWSIAEASAFEIDELNILQATFLAMRRAVEGLAVKPDQIYVDGNKTPDFGIPSQAVVKGDRLVPAISAASIIAKVARDQWMIEFAQRHPQWGFEKHKGYPTAVHMEVLARLGPLPEHRRSFRPVREAERPS